MCEHNHISDKIYRKIFIKRSRKVIKQSVSQNILKFNQDLNPKFGSSFYFISKQRYDTEKTVRSLIS